MQTDAFQAVTRFGLGASRDGFSSLRDPKGWLIDQLRHPSVPDEVKQQPGDVLTIQTGENKKLKLLTGADGQKEKIKQAYLETSFARATAQINSTQPFIERLVLFWSNHFTVSLQKPIIAGIVNRYEVEAIRPNVTGYFRDMLLATAKHPAMLIYLDNAQSIGPHSIAGVRREKGLNENYAREVMELHTLGVNGGYTQADVTALAAILTGWSLKKGEPGERILEYEFQQRFHEPGSKSWLGYTVNEAGEGEGIAALETLAKHPSTARYIATRFARYFMGESVSKASIDALIANFQQTGGHLGRLAETLVNLPEAWEHPLSKFKDPYDYALSLWRALGRVPEQKQWFGMLDALDYRMFNAPSPAGFEDSVSRWAAPDSVNKSIELAYRIAQKLPGQLDPMAAAETLLGPVLSDLTKQTISRAATARDGMALLFSSPEFLRR